MQTRLQLFQNIIEAMDDPTANFRVGRNIRVNKDMGAVKTTFEGGVKGVLKVFGVNPAKVLAGRMPDANRALNKFLDTRVVQYGPNFMDVRVEYFKLEDVSVEGDHYTLGTILGGLETISAYKNIEIKALQTPFDTSVETIKARMFEPGMSYTFEGYVHNPKSPVFLYRYTFQEPAQLPKRIWRAIGDFARRNLPSNMTRIEMQDEERKTQFLLQRDELDERARSEYKALITAERARADAAEARLRVAEALAESQRLQAENRGLTLELKTMLEAGARIKGIAHDIKGLANKTLVILLPEVRGYLQQHPEAMETYGIGPEVLDYQGIDKNGYKDPLIGCLNRFTAESKLETEIRLLLEMDKGVNLLSNAVEEIQNARAIMGTDEETARLQELNVYTVMEEVIRYVKGMNQTPIQITNNIPRDLIVKAIEREYRSCLTNLIDNAIYASAGGTLKIMGEYEGEFTKLDIYQSGYLTPEMAQKLNRGQAESSRKEHGGNGIGARTSFLVVQKHNGKLKYKSLGEQGALTQLWLDTQGYKPQESL
jgi:signal transduction histidine kinase